MGRKQAQSDFHHYIEAPQCCMMAEDESCGIFESLKGATLADRRRGNSPGQLLHN
jgi:hypothetical protein